MTNKIASLMVVATAMFTVSCEETDYMRFNTSDSGIYFTKDTLDYSFGVTPMEIRTYTYNIPVRVLGGVSEKDRTIAYEVIEDSTFAEEGVQYRIVSSMIPAGEIDGYISVELLRDGLTGTHIEGYTHYRLGLRLAENREFTPTLDEAHQIRVLHFDNAIEQPDWKNSKGEKIWSVGELGVWHPLKFIKMVEYFHAIEDILPDTYANMVKAYGENLEHIPYGNPHLYRTIFNKYIYHPMYLYFSDPANRDAILEEHPDFPFDFPNPFA